MRRSIIPALRSLPTRLPDLGPGRALVLRSRRSRRIVGVSLLAGGISLAAVSAGTAVLGDGLAPIVRDATSPAASSTSLPPAESSAASPAPSEDGPGAIEQSTPRSTPPSTAAPTTPAPAPEPAYPAADGERIDAERIRDFLADRDSPLADEAETFVAAGIAHDVDPRVVVAIAIAESNGGERLPAGSHNAWGWGGSGPHGLAAWGSWEESIHDFTERLGQGYATDEVSVDFARTYCPPNWRWWHDTVTWAVAQI